MKKPFDDFSVEHGPQDGGQSRLGPAVVAVLACRNCNNGSGATYEAEAAVLNHGEELADFTPEELVSRDSVNVI